MKRQAFTLIELLMTVAIVVILAGILVPAVMSGIKKGQQAKAKAEIVTLLNAIKQYESTYNRLPIPQDTDYSTAMTKGVDVSANLINALQGQTGPLLYGSTRAINPRAIRFLELKDAGGGTFQDPWQNEYQIIFVASEEIPLTRLYSGNTTGGIVHQDVVIWSAGPDGEWDTKDDVHSFEAEYEAGQWHVTN